MYMLYICVVRNVLLFLLQVINADVLNDSKILILHSVSGEIFVPCH